jgi:hypothetical protein
MNDAMTSPEPAHDKSQRRAVRTARILAILAGLVLVLTVVTAVIPRIFELVDRPHVVALEAIADIVGRVAVGLALATMLLVLASAHRLQHQLKDALSRLERFEYEKTPRADSSAPAGETESSAQKTALQMHEMLLMLRDIRDNSLLSEEERREKKSRVSSDDVRHAQQLIRGLVDEGSFAQARQMAEEMARKYPENPTAAQLVSDVESHRVKRERTDIREAAKQVGDLVSISAWDRARTVAQQLRDRHPDSTEAKQIGERIDRDFELFQAEQRRRMYAEIQRYVSRRRWREALAAARTFMDRFPNSDETASLQAQTDTLVDNAEIETRQELEAEITDLARHGRYIEAADFARRLIDRYPDSPQAEVLRQQLPRLEELANDPNAPPARVRVDD